MFLEMNANSKLGIETAGNLSSQTAKGFFSSLYQVRRPPKMDVFTCTYKKMLHQSSAEQINEYGVLLLVDQLLKTDQKKNNTRQLKVAQQLLRINPQLQIRIHPPKSIEAMDFIGSMITTAEAIIKKKDALYLEMKNSAFQLTDRGDRLMQTLSTRMESHTPRKILSWKDFFPAWLKFTRLFLEEHINVLLQN
ncbi:MAG: hypothetical protein ACE5GN_00410 [Waddliaceae bacterium]